jgi:hypothetical protein
MQVTEAMNLRDHPLLSHRGVRSWPPAWHWLGDGKNHHPKGEVGILKQVKVPTTSPLNRCFLVIEYAGAFYMGCVLSDDVPFAIGLGRLLASHCNKPLESIGSIEIDHLL